MYLLAWVWIVIQALNEQQSDASLVLDRGALHSGSVDDELDGRAEGCELLCAVDVMIFRIPEARNDFDRVASMCVGGADVSSGLADRARETSHVSLIISDFD